MRLPLARERCKGHTPRGPAPRPLRTLARRPSVPAMMTLHKRPSQAPLAVLLTATLTACSGGEVEAPGPVQNGAADAPPHLVMVSFDGMRHDFLDRVPTPNFQRVADAGIRAEGLISAYPSKTFPNHYTLATGLYPANHGIVDNAFYDPAFDAIYALGDAETVQDGRWYDGEPLWMTAERHGAPAASFFWVGCEATGQRPTYWKPYDGDVPNASRVDTVLSWLRLPAGDRPRVTMLYFSDVDGAAHYNGPDAPEVDEAIREMDELVGRLLDGLAETPIGDAVNLIIVSDHGMAPVPVGNVVFLDDYVDLEDVRVVYNTTQALLYFNGDEARLWEVYEALEGRLENATVYLKEELPDRWHYDGSRRVGELVVAADPGWLVASRAGRPWRGGGMHGWEPAMESMHGIFMAAGPDVRPAGRLEPFENIHVYPFAAALAGLEPAAGIDGRAEVLADYLTAVPAR